MRRILRGMKYIWSVHAVFSGDTRKAMSDIQIFIFCISGVCPILCPKNFQLQGGKGGDFLRSFCKKYYPILAIEKGF